MSTSNICFIGGSGRSGTTILREVLAARRDFATAGEIRLLTDPDGIADFWISLSASWSPTYYDVRLRRLAQLLRAVGRSNPLGKIYLRALNRSGLIRALPYVPVSAYVEVGVEEYCPGYVDMVDELLAELTQFRFRARWIGSEFLQATSLAYHVPFEREQLVAVLGGFLRRLIGSIVRRQQARWFVDDTPWNLLWFDRLVELLPEAKLVHIYRDPRDVVASFMNQRWSPPDPIQAAAWYHGIMEQWRRVRERLSRDSFIELSLEELVSNREWMLHAVCQFLGVEWDDAVLTVDLGGSHSGRWKNLTPEAQAGISGILQPDLALMGYA